MNFIALVANGQIANYPKILERLKAAKLVIAVDGGLVHCDKMGIIPSLLIGDLDSCPEELIEKYPQLKVERYSVDKDETDLEIALKAADKLNLPMHLFGALGLRTDHSLYNLHLIRRYPGKAIIESDNEIITVIANRTTIDTIPGQTVSLIPIDGPAEGVTTRGLKWELDNAQFDFEKSSISNIALGTSFTVSIDKGDLLCINTIYQN